LLRAEGRRDADRIPVVGERLRSGDAHVDVEVEVQPGVEDVRVVADVRPNVHHVAASGGEPMVVRRDGQRRAGRKGKDQGSDPGNDESTHLTISFSYPARAGGRRHRCGAAMLATLSYG